MSREDRMDRKQLKKPDTFVEKGRMLLQALFDQRRSALAALVVVVVACVGYYAYDAWSTRRLTRDWISFYKADEAKGEERTQKIKATYEGGGSTRAALVAAVTLADHYYEAAAQKTEEQKVKDATGKAPKKAEEELEPKLNQQQAADQAVEWYDKALRFSLLLPGERELLTLNKGHAQELQNKFDEALASYKSVVDMAGESKGLAMIHAGRMHELKKQPAEAKSMYQSVSTEFGTTEYARIAKNYLRRMDSALLSPPTGKP